MQTFSKYGQCLERWSNFSSLNCRDIRDGKFGSSKLRLREPKLCAYFPDIRTHSRGDCSSYIRCFYRSHSNASFLSRIWGTYPQIIIAETSSCRKRKSRLFLCDKHPPIALFHLLRSCRLPAQQ